MPWKIFEKDDKHCVYKVDSENEPTELVHCHGTNDEAVAQMQALYASEKKSLEYNEMSFSDLMSNISNAFSNQFRGVFSENENDLYKNFYVCDYYSNYIIVDTYDGCYKVSYYRKEDEIIFADKSEWTPVARQTEWVKKSISLTGKNCIKEIGENRVGAYGILWGDEARKDFHDEYFTPETEELTSVFKAMGKIPFLFHHGNHEGIKSTVIGAVDKMEPDEIGLWYEAIILEHQKYQEFVKPLIQQNVLYSSSGTFPAAKRATRSGQITRWPIAEMTATHMPAEWRMVANNRPIAEIKAAYKSINLSDDIDLFAENNSVDSEKEIAKIKAINNQLRLKLQLLRTK